LITIKQGKLKKKQKKTKKFKKNKKKKTKIKKQNNYTEIKITKQKKTPQTPPGGPNRCRTTWGPPVNVDRFVTGLPTSNPPLNPTSKKLDYRSALQPTVEWITMK
jgi:hypothetical protein